MQPPPLPDTVKTPNVRLRRAAAASLAAPLIALVAGLIWFSAHHGESVNRGASLVMGGLGVVLVVVGFVLGVVALSGISRHGKQGVLALGISGVIINGLIMVAMVAFMMAAVGHKAQERQQAFKELESASRDLRNSLGSNYDSKLGATNDFSRQLGDYKSRLDSAASRASGADALILQAVSDYTGRIQAETQKYHSALEQLTRAKVTNFSTLTNRDQIEERREVVRNFLAANNSFKKILNDQGQVMQSELLARNVSPAKVDSFMAGFNHSQAPILPKVNAIRDWDDKMGQAFLKILDLAEAQWGRFRCDDATGKTIFLDHQAADEFNSQLAVVRQAGRDQVRLQGEIIQLQKLQSETAK